MKFTQIFKHRNASKMSHIKQMACYRGNQEKKKKIHPKRLIIHSYGDISYLEN
jgi:hypothetical protein